MTSRLANLLITQYVRTRYFMVADSVLRENLPQWGGVNVTKHGNEHAAIFKIAGHHKVTQL